MSAIAAILLEAAGSLAVPVIKKILGDKIGGAGGELAGNVIDIIAGQAGVPVEKLPDVKPAELAHSVVRNPDGSPASPIGYVVDDMVMG